MIILVTDDVDDIRELMKLLLKSHGHDVDTAANGQEAVRAATQRVPDVVLMDLCMPVMDGFEATRALRLIPGTCRVPIIAVSAYVGDKEWCDKAIAAGCNACIGKPIDFETLDDVLRLVVSTPLQPRRVGRCASQPERARTASLHTVSPPRGRRRSGPLCARASSASVR